jgi:hypothetical protein
MNEQVQKNENEQVIEDTTEVREVSRRVINVSERRGEAQGSSNNVNVTVREVRGGTTEVSGGQSSIESQQARYGGASYSGNVLRGGLTTEVTETTTTETINRGGYYQQGGQGQLGYGNANSETMRVEVNSAESESLNNKRDGRYGNTYGTGAGSSSGNVNMNAEFRFGGTIQTNTTSEVRQVESHTENAQYQEVKIASGSGSLDKPTQERLREAVESHKYIKIALYIGIILSTINICLGIGIGAKFSATIAGYVVGCGLFSLSVFIAGLFISNKYVGQCEAALLSNDLAKCEAVDQSWERTLLNIWLYMVMIIFLIFLIATIGCFGFKEEARLAIEGASKNQDTWHKYFGDRTYEYIDNSITTLLNVTGFFALLLFLYCGILLGLSFRLLGAYRTFQTVLEFICLLFFCFGFGFLYLAIYSQRYRDVAKVDKAMPGWVPDALLASSIISVVVAVVGYCAIYLENRQYIKYFGIGALVFTALILIFAIGGFVFAAKLDTYFDNNCNNVLDYIKDDYLTKYADCQKKYAFTGISLDSMLCPKDRIVSVWEQNLGKNLEDHTDVYGCLDSDCCFKTFSAIKSKVDYLAIIAAVLFILGTFLTIGSYFMYVQLSQGFEHGIGKTVVNKAMLIAAVVVAIIMVIFIAFIPSPPETSPTFNVTVEKSSEKAHAVYVPSVLPNIGKVVISEEEKNKVTISKETVITQDLSKCTANNTCPKLRYSYDFVTNDGTLTFTEEANKNAAFKLTANKLEANGEYWLKFTGDASTLANYIKAYSFTARCPLQTNVVRLRVSAEAIPYDAALIQTGMSFVQLSNKLKQDTANTGTGSSSSRTTSYSHSSYSSSGDGAPEGSTYTYESETSTSNDTPATATSTFTVDPSTLKVGDKFEVFDKVLDHSMISTDKVTIKARILKADSPNNNTPVSGASIKLTSIDFPNCNALTFTSDAAGKFVSSKINLIEGNLPSEYLIEITSGDLSTYSKRFTIGGMGFEHDYDLGDIILWSSTMVQKSTVGSTILNSLTNKPEGSVTVKLFQGYIDVNNELDNASSAKSFIQLQQAPPEAPVQGIEITTGSDGTFAFNDLPPSTYTLIFEKDGFYREVRRIYIF